MSPRTTRARSQRRVSRLGRWLDVAGLLLFAVGGGLVAWAWTGFRSVNRFQPSPQDGAWAAVRLADQYWRLQKIGTALMVAGAAVFVWAWWVAGRGGRPTDSSDAAG